MATNAGDPGTRAALLKAARRLLDRRGAASVRMADVAAAAGVSRQAVYLHFGTRTQLLLDLLEHIDEAEGLPALVAHVVAAPDGPSMLDRLATMYARFYPRIHRAVEAIDAARRSDPAADAAWRGRMASRMAGCTGMVERLRAEGVLSPEFPPNRAADLLFTLTAIEGWRTLVVERGWSAATYVTYLRRTLRSTLLE